MNPIAMKTIGITGATGQLGQLVLQLNKENTIALARSASKAAALGVPARQFDYVQPSTAALEGIDTLLLISSNELGQRAVQHGNVIEAAKTAGVGHIVYTSLLHADTSALSLADEHLATEKLLAGSGVPFTLLRNGWYTENYTSGIHGAVATGALIGSAKNGRISSAARLDYAAAAVAVLANPELQGKTYELAGDTSYTLTDLAAEISRQTGRTIPYNDLPVNEYAAILTQIGLPAPLADAIAGWDAATAQGALLDDSKQLSALIGRPTTTLAATVAAILKP